MKENRTGILSTSQRVVTGTIHVQWLTVSDTAALAMELNDSLDNSGTDQWGISLPAGGYAHFIFQPPLVFSNGIYLHVSTATCKVIIGYV